MAMISNPIRKRILEVLSRFPSLPYLKLMAKCQLSHPSHCSVFTYHLKKLLETGAIAKKGDEYYLTALGEEWTRLIERMEGEYLSKGSEVLDFTLDKWCPMCLKAHLRARVTTETISIKCENQECIIGGPIDRPVYYIATGNKIPDWRKRGLDIYDLVLENSFKSTEVKVKLYRAGKCLECGSENLIVEEFGPWYNKQCKDCGNSWGCTVINAWEFPETLAFLKMHHKVAETMIGRKVMLDGKGYLVMIYTDLDTGEKLVMYADAETLRPVKICIDLEGRPVEGEITREELVEEFIVISKRSP